MKDCFRYSLILLMLVGISNPSLAQNLEVDADFESVPNSAVEKYHGEITVENTGEEKSVSTGVKLLLKEMGSGATTGTDWSIVETLMDTKEIDSLKAGESTTLEFSFSGDMPDDSFAEYGEAYGVEARFHNYDPDYGMEAYKPETVGAVKWIKCNYSVEGRLIGPENAEVVFTESGTSTEVDGGRFNLKDTVLSCDPPLEVKVVKDGEILKRTDLDLSRSDKVQEVEINAIKSLENLKTGNCASPAVEKAQGLPGETEEIQIELKTDEKIYLKPTNDSACIDVEKHSWKEIKSHYDRWVKVSENENIVGNEAIRAETVVNALENLTEENDLLSGEDYDLVKVHDRGQKGTKAKVIQEKVIRGGDLREKCNYTIGVWVYGSAGEGRVYIEEKPGVKSKKGDKTIFDLGFPEPFQYTCGGNPALVYESNGTPYAYRDVKLPPFRGDLSLLGGIRLGSVKANIRKGKTCEKSLDISASGYTGGEISISGYLSGNSYKEYSPLRYYLLDERYEDPCKHPDKLVHLETNSGGRIDFDAEELDPYYNNPYVNERNEEEYEPDKRYRLVGIQKRGDKLIYGKSGVLSVEKSLGDSSSEKGSRHRIFLNATYLKEGEILGIRVRSDSRYNVQITDSLGEKVWEERGVDITYRKSGDELEPVDEDKKTEFEADTDGWEAGEYTAKVSPDKNLVESLLSLFGGSKTLAEKSFSVYSADSETTDNGNDDSGSTGGDSDDSSTVDEAGGESQESSSDGSGNAGESQENEQGYEWKFQDYCVKNSFTPLEEEFSTAWNDCYLQILEPKFFEEPVEVESTEPAESYCKWLGESSSKEITGYGTDAGNGAPACVRGVQDG